MNFIDISQQPNRNLAEADLLELKTVSQRQVESNFESNNEINIDGSLGNKPQNDYSQRFEASLDDMFIMSVPQPVQSASQEELRPMQPQLEGMLLQMTSETAEKPYVEAGNQAARPP